MVFTVAPISLLCDGHCVVVVMLVLLQMPMSLQLSFPSTPVIPLLLSLCFCCDCRRVFVEKPLWLWCDPSLHPSS